MTRTGEYAVDVRCTDAAFGVGKITVTAVEGMTLTQTIAATLTNSGPDPLPAGIPVGFYDANGRLAGLGTSMALAAGGQETLSVTPWTVPAAGRYELIVVPADPDLGTPVPVAFCTTPGAERALVWAGPLPEMLPVYVPLILFGAAGPGPTEEPESKGEESAPGDRDNTIQ